MKTFDEMVGQTVKFYGVYCNCFKLEKLVFEALEDEDDGYRSCLDEVKVVDKGTMIFQRRMLARVKVEEFDDGSFDGWQLVDAKDGHVWLSFGTDMYDDYYPMFTFDYHPKEA